MDEPRRSASNPLASLASPSFRLFYVAFLIGTIGTQILFAATLWQIYELTGSALHLGLTGLARAAPIILLSLAGGVIADRVNRVKFMALTQGLSGTLPLALALLTATNLVDVWHIYVITFLSSTLQAISSPARVALVPSLVPGRHMLNAIALTSTIYQGANIIGPAIGGVGIAAFGLAPTYLVNGLAHVVSLGALAFVHAPPIPVVKNESPWRSMLEGLAFVRVRSVILAMLLMDTAATLLGSYRTLVPIIAVSLGYGAEGMGLLLAAPGIGSLLGSGGILALGNMRYKGWYVIGGILAYCGGLVLLGLSPWFGVSLIAAGLLGLFDSVQMIPRNTAIQAMTPDGLRGRVSSFQMTFSGGAPALGQATSGALAAVVGAPWALVMGAVSCAAVILGFAVARKDLRDRNLGEGAPEDGRPAWRGEATWNIDRQGSADATAFPSPPTPQTRR
jgi:MFS family permease